MAFPKLPLGPAPFGGFALDPGSGQLSVGQSGVAAGAAANGQAGATQLVSLINRVVVGNTNDGLLLPTAIPGLQVVVINATANSLNVYPAPPGDIINALAANAAYAVAATKVVEFYCANQGQWHTVLTA